MTGTESLFLVTGATGTQGGCTARALLEAGHRVRILTRNPESSAAVALLKLGAETAKGDLGDAASLAAAVHGVRGVFSVQKPDVDGSDSERRHGFALISAARQAGVRHFVHASVCQAGEHERFPRWQSGYWARKYWTDKADIEEAVREAGFPSWTVLRPSFMMDNFMQPKADVLFPQLRQGLIVTPIAPRSRLQLICGDDIGAFARAAFEQPARFDRKILELATDDLTIGDIAAVLSRELGRSVSARSVSPEEAQKAGLFPGWVRAQEWINEVGYHADIGALKPHGVPLTSFPEWVRRHASEIAIDT